MDLLIVGAGAVGSTYGYLASRGGAKVTYLIKPKHRADLANGAQLYWWQGRTAESVVFRDFDLIDDPKSLRSRKFDAVLITLPSDKFRAGGWLAAFLADFEAGSPDARIWSLQPAANDQAYLREKVGEAAFDARVVRGKIPILGYLAPLPGESFEKTGHAFYVPPGAKATWSAKNGAAAEEAARLFDAGGLASKVVDGAPKAADLVPEALLRGIVAGLERSEWSFDRLLNGENLHLATGAMREMMAIGAKHQKTADPSAKWWVRLATSAPGVKALVRLARKIIPFDFEGFMRVHFTKVDAQMHLNLDEQIEFAKRNGIPTTNLVLLRGRRKPSSSEKSPTPSPTSPSR